MFFVEKWSFSGGHRGGGLINLYTGEEGGEGITIMYSILNYFSGSLLRWIIFALMPRSLQVIPQIEGFRKSMPGSLHHIVVLQLDRFWNLIQNNYVIRNENIHIGNLGSIICFAQSNTPMPVVSSALKWCPSLLEEPTPVAEPKVRTSNMLMPPVAIYYEDSPQLICHSDDDDPSDLDISTRSLLQFRGGSTPNTRRKPLCLRQTNDIVTR